MHPDVVVFLEQWGRHDGKRFSALVHITSHSLVQFSSLPTKPAYGSYCTATAASTISLHYKRSSESMTLSIHVVFDLNKYIEGVYIGENVQEGL